MILKANSNGGGEFEKAPEAMGRGVLVDVTPLKDVESTFNGKVTKRQVFRMVFELDPDAFGTKKNGDPFGVWSRNFTASLNERSALRPFLEQMLGRPLTSAELSGFDTEALIGTPVKICVVHTPSKDGTQLYANIASVKPWKPEENGGKLAYVASGKFVREQDRPAKDDESGASASFRRADKPEGAERDPWQRCKVHVGHFAGMNLGDLDKEPFLKLYNNWRPTVSARQAAGERISADDCRLLAALEAGKKDYDAREAAQNADVPAEDMPY